MATIKEIADKLGVSISTVSKGLNNASDISEDMRQTVLNTAVELGYVRKKKKNTRVIKFCIITEDVDQQNINQSNYELISGFRTKANEDMYQIDVISIGILAASRLTYDLFITQNAYSGVLLLASVLPPELEQQLAITKIPTVVFNNKVYNPCVASVGSDYYEGFYRAISFAAERGHKSIGFIDNTPHSSCCHSMERAFCQTMEKLNNTIDPSLIFFLSSDPASIRSAVMSLLSRGASLVICSNDIAASSVITEAYRLGKKVPEDLSVIGFDDLPIARYLSPPLTTVRQDRIALGRCGYYALKSLMLQIPVGAIVMHPQLIIRESVASLN